MDGLVEFKMDDGAVVAVEAMEEERGSRLIGRRREDGTIQAARTFEGALDGVRSAAESALRVFRDGALQPDGVEIEFGVKLSAEAGAFIAKGTAEGHLVVKLTWSPSQSPTPSPTPAPSPSPTPSRVPSPSPSPDREVGGPA